MLNQRRELFHYVPEDLEAAFQLVPRRRRKSCSRVKEAVTAALMVGRTPMFRFPLLPGSRLGQMCGQVCFYGQGIDP